MKLRANPNDECGSSLDEHLAKVNQYKEIKKYYIPHSSTEEQPPADTLVL